MRQSQPLPIFAASFLVVLTGGLGVVPAQQTPAPSSANPPQRGATAAPAARRPGATVQPAAPPGAEVKIQQAPAPAPDPRRMDAVLEAWAKRTQATQTFYAKFTRSDVVQAWKDRTDFDGVAVLKSPNLAYLDFKKLGPDGKPTPHERIVVTTDHVYQFDSTKKQVHIYQMSQDAQQRALDEGPLPFLFNMQPDRARERYAMTLRQENEKHYLIAVEPRQEADRQAFGKAYIWLNKQKFLPDQIVLVDPNNGKDTKTYAITEVKINVSVEESWFDGKKQAEDVAKAQWDLVHYSPEGQPVGGERGAAGAGSAVPTGPVAQPAQRGLAAPRR